MPVLAPRSCMTDRLIDHQPPQELAIFVNALGRLAFAAGSNGYRPPRIFMEKVRLLFEAKVRPSVVL